MICVSHLSLPLPDLLNWNIYNVINIDGIFYRCKSLKFLPDLSKWNISKIEDMSYIFSGCESLESLSDISNLDNYNDTNI